MVLMILGGRCRVFNYYWTAISGDQMYPLQETIKNGKILMFLDSGAYSAHRKGVNINIHEYIDFIKQYRFDWYANLDVIGDAEGTLKNQKIMEKAGLLPIPTFHAKEDFKYLKRYVDGYDYIALGGVAQLAKKAEAWMEECFDIICDKQGYPKTKVHGFAVTSNKLMFKFPWYSVDSTSWLMSSSNGVILIPQTKNGKKLYEKTPVKVVISEKNPKKEIRGAHLNTMSPVQKDILEDYIRMKGFDPDELRDPKNHKIRDAFNVEYYFDVQKNIPPYPTIYQRKIKRTLI